MTERCYVNSIAQVSCQAPLTDEWFDTPLIREESYVRAQEPDTKGLIVPSEARRMSKILKRCVCTAISALNQSDIDHPEAIITGTGMGCLENSEKFLIDLSRFGESCLKPTLFMQSTHNTLSSLIAIILKCHGYNNTYSHKGISFESALLDAWMQLRTGMLRNALVGGHDEVTPFMDLLMERTHPEYGFVSEASVSAMLTSVKSAHTICEVEDVGIYHRPSSDTLSGLLDADRDSLLLLGVSGNELNDTPYRRLISSLSYRPRTLHYKHVFGENFSASALGFYTAVMILKTGRVPAFLHDRDGDKTEAPRRITLVNHSEGSAWSIVRLTKSEATCSD